MYDEVYGYTVITVEQGDEVYIPIYIKNGVFDDYNITMSIYNEISKCNIISDIPVNENPFKLIGDLTSKLKGYYMVIFKMINTNTDETVYDKTRLKVI